MTITLGYINAEVEEIRNEFASEAEVWITNQAIREFDSVDKRMTQVIETSTLLYYWTSNLIFRTRGRTIDEYELRRRHDHIRLLLHALLKDITECRDTFLDVTRRVALADSREYRRTVDVIMGKHLMARALTMEPINV